MGSTASMLGRRVRRHRQAAGLSQAELALRSGVSRQAVGAMEAGRHLPRVDAALRVAAALGLTVEELLAGDAADDDAAYVRHVTGDLPVADGPARAARVGDQVVVVPLASGDGATFPTPDAVVVDGRVEVLDGADLDGFVLVGCDPALGILAALAPDRGPGRILAVPGSSTDARRALEEGRAHAAVVHDRAGQLGEVPPGTRRLRLATWRTGLAAPAHAPAPLGDALADGRPIIQRDTGAAAQQAAERAAGEVTLPHAGRLATSHLDAARRAAATGGTAVTIEPAALALGLAFHALETHGVDILIAPDASHHAGARALVDVLDSARLRRHLSVLPAYHLGVA